MFETPALRRIFVGLRRFRDSTGLTVAALLAVAVGIVALAGTVVGFSGITEDVWHTNGLATSDPARLQWFIDHRPAALVSAARIGSELGGPIALLVLAVVAAGVLWMRGRRLLVALAPGIAFGVSGFAVAVTKKVVDRSRPPVPLHLVPESNASFPSGHATESTALFVTLALVVAVFVLRRPIARATTVLGAGVLSFVVGASRLVLGVHWPSDVLAGWVMGAGIALAVTLVASLVAHVVPTRPISNRPLARLVHLASRERAHRERQSRPQPLEAA
jgi:membrane-associated phospholipid phosphatase